MRLVCSALGQAAAMIALSQLASTVPKPVHGQVIGDESLRGAGFRALHKKSKRAHTSRGKGGRKSKRVSESKSKERKATTIYETVDFEVDDNLCGSFLSVKSSLEAAFQAFFEAEFEGCGSDREVQSLVLVSFKEAKSCSDDESKSRESRPKGKGKDKKGGRELETRELQRRLRGRGRLNRKSICRDCDRRMLEGVHKYAGAKEESKQGLVHNPADCYDNCNSKNPCIDRIPGYYEHCDNEKFIQCGAFGECFVRPCAPGTAWSQLHQTCSEKGCNADLVREFQNAGFPDVKEVEITKVKKVHCSSNSKNCKSTDPKRGACCGVDGCACNIPSESLCQAKGCCIESAHPFNPDFCDDFCDTSKCGLDYSRGD